MKRAITTIISVIILTSCSRWIAPPYTNVDQLSLINIGMRMDEVNQTLGIEPYDVYFMGSDGDFIVIYNYRVKDKQVTVSGDYNNAIHSEKSQASSSEYYGKDWYGEKYFSYVYFKDKKVQSIITDKGKQKSENILIKNNNIFLIQKDQLGYYTKNDSIFFVPLR